MGDAPNTRDLLAEADGLRREIASLRTTLAEARRLMKPFGDLDVPADPKWTCGTFLIEHDDIRAIASFLATPQQRTGQ